MEKLKELERVGRQLEPAAEQREVLTAEMVTYTEQFLQSLPLAAGYRKGKPDKLKSFEVEEDGKPLSQLLSQLQEEVDTIGINSASGRHLGYIPGGGLYSSAMADMVAAVSNRYAGIAFSSPGAVEIENQMIRWLAKLVGYPSSAHGNLTSGGSIANLVAIQAARDFHGINSTNVRQSVVYFTEQVHHCNRKALHITGLYEALQRTIPVNEKYQMDVSALEKQVAADVAAGLKPFLVIATAGTTDTGAVDPLNQVAAIAEKHRLWFHVDAAYGGFFMLVEEMKGTFRGIERSDSVVLDPHKTLFMPFGSGVVLLKDRNRLLASNSHTGAYMKDTHGLEEVSPADTGPELSRHFRGLRMWLPLHLHGVAPFRANLEEKLLLSRYFYEQIAAMGFETGPAPELSVAIFRLPGDEGNVQNQQLIEQLHHDGTVFLSSTAINGKVWIRCAVVHFRTHLREIEMALKMIKENAEKIAARQ